jgi:hypothetical protein
MGVQVLQSERLDSDNFRAGEVRWVPLTGDELRHWYLDSDSKQRVWPYPIGPAIPESS